jgi:hypothetical protein
MGFGMIRDEVLSKVRKLFELANSPNEHEAALAAAKARELLSRYNLSIADLPAAEMKDVICATEKSVRVGRVIRNWVKGLLLHVAQGFDCEHVIRRRHGCSPVLTFIGTTADVEVAVYTFHFLYRQLDRLVERALPRLKRENRGWGAVSLRYAYLDGAVKRIGERLRERVRSIKEAERNGCKDLVVAKEQMIGQYMASAFSCIKTEYGRRRVVSATAFDEGYQDAGTVSLRTAITDSASDRCPGTS